MRIFLLPISVIYWLVIKIKNWLYQIGVLNSWKSPIPVICVGNISVGGQGKTPALISLTNELINRNKKVVIVSRGYKRKTKGYFEVDSINASSYGDEPAMIKMNLPSVNVVVCEDRVHAIKNIQTKFNPDLVMMDDGLQNKSVMKDYSISVFDRYNLNHNLFIEKFLIPAGNLREPFKEVFNYDAVIINHKFYTSDLKTSSDLMKRLFQHNCFEANYILEGFFDDGGRRIELEHLKEKQNYIFCGIAKPESFERLFNCNSIRITSKNFFPDHYRYTSKDIQNLIDSAKQFSCENLITTEKDYVRLIQFTDQIKKSGMSILYSKISMKIFEVEKLLDLILYKVRREK
ncbi:MAG: tetraacyldisaccharide 4'-kinase [Ignavibacteria bacterium]|nr:tetraacyldisaccharide 4'-kinase [Ignavibacteria bacterium]